VVEDRWGPLYDLNPLAGLIDAFRWSLLGTPRPGLDALASLGVTALLLIVGLAVFAREERRFADII
jgi:lipopolysaccharide transport system permease protein